jgi:hypothetical protein
MRLGGIAGNRRRARVSAFCDEAGRVQIGGHASGLVEIGRAFQGPDGEQGVWAHAHPTGLWAWWQIKADIGGGEEYGTPRSCRGN